MQTRYYDPEVGRFLNIDSLDYADPETINGLNLYAYCGNNPVAKIDPYGIAAWWEFWKWDWAKIGMIAASVGEVIAGVAVTVASGGALLDKGIGLIGTGIGSIVNGSISESNGGSFVAGWTGGQVSGLFSTFVPYVGSVIGAFGGSIVTDLINEDKINWSDAALSAGIGLLLSGPSYVFGKVANIATDKVVQFVNGYNSFMLTMVGSLIDILRGKKRNGKQ